MSFNHLAGVRADRGEIHVTDFRGFGGAPGLVQPGAGLCCGCCGGRVLALTT
jgi:hypothetical protein